MTSSSNNGHVNPFYLEIEEEHEDDDELSDYEDDGFEHAGLIRQISSAPPPPPPRSRTTTSQRKLYRRICLFLLVVLALLAMKWDRKITPGGSEGEKLPGTDNVDDDDDDVDEVNIDDDDSKNTNDNNSDKDNHQSNKDTQNDTKNTVDKHSCFHKGDSPIRITSDDGALRYACPCTLDNTERPATHSMFPDHSSQITNMTSFMKTFRHMELDDWGHSYAEVKKGMHEWITTRYAEYLTDGSLIYESALGEGLHLHMVLDILLETKQIRNITVYGNDLSSGSVQVATAMGKQGFLPAGGKLGTICPGDSTQLQFVPSESFDLVFAAYIPPLSDPLELNPPNNDPLNAYLTLCKKAEDNKDEEAMKQKREAQHVQDRWFAQWLAELARVAKKGAPILVEHISYP